MTILRPRQWRNRRRLGLGQFLRAPERLRHKGGALAVNKKVVPDILLIPTGANCLFHATGPRHENIFSGK